MIDYKDIETKWQKAWEDAKVFQPEPNDKEGLLVTAAIPYVNSPPHIGHLRTYGTADTYARYMRMRGRNVLYPFGFHATGTPVIAFAKRIAKGDKELIDELKLFHVADEDIKKMTDPVFITEYFIRAQEADFRRAGMGVDWRRKFVTTEPLFSKLIEWQFSKLKEKGLLIQGTHPIGWCTNESQPVGQHDTKNDAQPRIEEITVVKFKDAESDAYFVCATYRPETIYGVTNLFVGESVGYVSAIVGGERYYMSLESTHALARQMKIEVEKTVDVKDLLARHAINPVTKETVPVLPGFFVKADVGTGVVMSVPSHAPFDYAALERLRAGNYALPQMEYKKLIEVEPLNGVSVGRSWTEGKRGRVTHPEIPALAYLELLNTNTMAVESSLEFATKLIYREESHWGVMLVGKYRGLKEAEARENLKKDLTASREAFFIYEISNQEPVYCRCGTKVVVNVVSDQWFINYGDDNWKNEVSRVLLKMRIYPDKYKHTFDAVVDWIDARATERAQGLGTKFPLNPEHIIESLSDSTIYMVFYTFVHILRQWDVHPEQLSAEFFDYVINSVGDVSVVARITGIDEIAIGKCRQSLQYWYSDTSRHSAPDLVYNHLVMYIFNHVALLPPPMWPKQIVVNGMVNYEGEKMSKSLGNIIPLGDGIAKYGSDPMRFIEIAGADLDTETEFSVDSVNSILSKNETLYGAVDVLNAMNGVELEHIDYWMYSRINTRIAKATEHMDRLEFRDAYTEVYYNALRDMKWYMDRGGHNHVVMRDFLESAILMLAPIMPHFAEEMWHRTGGTSLVVQEKWPEPNAGLVNAAVEDVESVIEGTVDDIAEVIQLSSKIDANKNKRISGIKIIVADNWKRIAYNMLLDHRNIARVVKDPGLKGVDPGKVAKFLGPFVNRLPTLFKVPEVDSKEVYDGFRGSAGYFKKLFRAEITVEMEGASASPRAGRALPTKPSIEVIWA